MQYNIDNRSSNKLSVLGFGCLRFPRNLGGIDYKKSEKLVLEAVKNGINYFDTAYLYFGSEEVLGKIIDENNLRDKIYIATKLPFSRCKNYDDFDKYFNEELANLRTEYIDYYLIHNMASVSQFERLKDIGIEKWIMQKKQSGQIKQIGFSFHGTKEQFPLLLDCYDWDFCQIQYNYLNINYQAGVSGLKYAHSKGLPVIIMEPLLGGKLAVKIPNEVKKIFRQINEYSPASWAFRWLYNQEGVTVVLSGMNEETQISENVLTASQSSKNSMTDKENEAIEKAIKIFNQLYKVNCTGCDYCMPCPKGVNIPACFSAYNMYYVLGKFDGFKHYILSTRMTSKEETAVASKCVSCGICAKKCPQNINIPLEIKSVVKTLEPKWLVSLINIRKMMHNRK